MDNTFWYFGADLTTENTKRANEALRLALKRAYPDEYEELTFDDHNHACYCESDAPDGNPEAVVYVEDGEFRLEVDGKELSDWTDTIKVEQNICDDGYADVTITLRARVV